MNPTPPAWWTQPPSWTVTLGLGLYVMTGWILWMLAPTQGHEPSELFKLLSQAIVLTAFVNGVVGAVYTASRDGQKKNDVIAAQAKVIADQAQQP